MPYPEKQAGNDHHALRDHPLQMVGILIPSADRTATAEQSPAYKRLLAVRPIVKHEFLSEVPPRAVASSSENLHSSVKIIPASKADKVGAIAHQDVGAGRLVMS